jgi:O-antigen/teichoic acid export membrane protein
MEERAVRSIPISLLSFACNKAITVGTTVVLARLLAPQDFGLYALALITMTLLSMFNDFGLGPVLVSRQDLDARGKGMVLTTMLATSAFLTAVLVALSSPVADLFDEPRLAQLLVIIAGTLALSGPVYFYETLMQRELEFKQRFAAMMVQTLTYAGVAITLTLLDHGVTGMVVASVCSYATYLVALVWLAPYHVRPAWEGRQILGLLRSGRGFLVQGGVKFVAQNTDNFSVGKFLGSGALGVYFLAYRLGELTFSGIAEPVTKVTFPGFARMRHRGEDWIPSFLSTLRFIALVAFPIGMLLSAAASPVTRFLYGPKWLEMIGPLAVLGLWAVMRPLEATLLWLLNAVGEADAAAVVTFLGLVLLIPGLLLAAAFVGLSGVAWVMAIHAALMVAVLATVIARRSGVPLRRQFASIGPQLLAAAVGWVATRAVADATATSAPVLSLGAAAAAGLATYAFMLSVTQPGLLREAAVQGGRTLRRPRAVV